MEANLRFVVSYCKRYRNLGIPYLDLIHEGTLGLMEAAKRFDPERNVRFISYAVWWVRQSILHAFSEGGRAFRVPQKLQGQVSRVERAREQLHFELERLPTLAELAKRTELPEDRVDALLLAAGDDLSLNELVGEEGNLERGDLIEQDNIPSIELRLIRDNIEQQIREMVKDLDAKERDVIRMRFGLDGEDPLTLQEIGETLEALAGAGAADREPGQGEAAPQPARPGAAGNPELVTRLTRGSSYPGTRASPSPDRSGARFSLQSPAIRVGSPDTRGVCRGSAWSVLSGPAPRSRVLIHCDRDLRALRRHGFPDHDPRGARVRDRPAPAAARAPRPALPTPCCAPPASLLATSIAAWPTSSPAPRPCGGRSRRP